MLHLPSDCFLVVEVDIPPQMVVLARVTRCERTRGRSGREFEFGWIEEEVVNLASFSFVSCSASH